MTVKEAYRAMLDGKKITHKSYPKNSYKYYESGAFCSSNSQLQEATQFGLHDDDGYKIYVNKDDALLVIEQYCEPYKDKMWAAAILGIINGVTFRGE